MELPTLLRAGGATTAQSRSRTRRLTRLPVTHQLVALERKGFLCRDPHRPRAYEVRGSDCNGELFVLKAVDDSVIAAAICDGDWSRCAASP